jgi:peptide/nickel transport system permease protein
MSTHEGEDEDDRLSTASTTSQSYPALVWRRFKRSFPGMIGLIMVSLLLLTAIFAEFIAPMDPNEPTASFAPPDHLSFFTKDGFTLLPVAYSIVEGDELDPITYQPLMSPDMDHPRYLTLFAKGTPFKLWGLIPMERHLIGVNDGSPLHLLGTDKLGRDILSRGVYGSRLTLMISLVSITLITIIGTLLGITSGYLGGRFDMWFQRFVEVILAFPQLPLYLALATLIPPTAPPYLFLSFVILVIVGLGWAQLSREVRGKTLSMSRIEYVRAAVAVGASDGRIITRHILPNVLSHVIVAVTLGIPTIILLESFLGFLGFAVKPPLISWGLMLQDAQTFASIGSYPWILSPVGFVLLAVFAFNALGDGLRDAVDPY